jgi:hypothetical protein
MAFYGLIFGRVRKQFETLGLLLLVLIMDQYLHLVWIDVTKTMEFVSPSCENAM